MRLLRLYVPRNDRKWEHPRNDRKWEHPRNDRKWEHPRNDTVLVVASYWNSIEMVFLAPVA